MASATDLGNGRGKVYVTGIEGDLSIVSPYNRSPMGRNNTQDELARLRRDIFPANTPSTTGAYATAIVELTAASAVNLTNVTIDGVAQIDVLSPVAMTAGDVTQSAIDAATAINAHAASPDWRATARDGALFLQCLVPGSAQNGLAVILSFSGAGTTYTATDTSGGLDVGGRPYRIFINTSTVPFDELDTVAWAANLAAATEITDQVSARGIDSPPLVVQADISGVGIIFTRSGNNTRVVVDGSTGSGTVENLAIAGMQDGDRLTFVGKAGSTAPVFVSNALLLLERDVTLDPGVSLTVWFSVDAAPGGAFVQDSASRFDAATARANGLRFPMQPGSYLISPATNVYTVVVGQAGASGAGIIYEQTVGFQAPAAVLAGSISFTVDTTNAVDGDSGTFSGNGIAVTLGIFQINFSDMVGLKASLSAEMALSGQWTVAWTVVDAGAGIVDFSVIPNFSTSNTQFLTTTMIKDASVTNVKLASGIDGAKLSADTVAEASLSPLVRAKLNAQGRTTVKNTILTAQVLTLNTVPVLAVAAPGVGYFTKVEQVQGKITYTAPIYATNLNLQLKFAGASVAIAQSSTFLIKTTNGIVEIGFNFTVAAGQTQIIENAALYWTVEVGDPTAGASDITMYTTYSIMAV